MVRCVTLQPVQNELRPAFLSRSQLDGNLLALLPGERKFGMKSGLFLICLAMTATSASAQSDALSTEASVYFPMAHIATFLFLMLGPTKIIAPFVSLTEGAEKTTERKIALLSVFFSGVALLLAGLLGEKILSDYGIPLPILALSGGIILFVVALLDSLRAAKPEATREAPSEEFIPPLRLALSPLAFPTIVPPYGIAALIVFLAFTPDTADRLIIGMIVIAIMLVNLLTMLFARHLVAIIGIGLSVLGAVLGVVQVALGLQIIHNSLLVLRTAW
jgi:multiple antibiotic resistance protein